MHFDIRWAVCETVQADIFDHLFAVVQEFGLRLFQNPSGNDFKAIVDESPKGEIVREMDH